MRPIPQRRAGPIAALLAAIALPACTAGAFACVDDASCSGGVCEASGYCSFPDADCDSGQRYGEHAPAELAGACVVPGAASTGTSSGSSSTSFDPPTTQDGTAPGEVSAGQNVLVDILALEALRMVAKPAEEECVVDPADELKLLPPFCTAPG